MYDRSFLRVGVSYKAELQGKERASYGENEKEKRASVTISKEMQRVGEEKRGIDCGN
ncbi:hypothetical protein AG1IA_02067 [Rhizoctonia solani AG-1 IA]|uniref:Uncharacterized protein n=1 Tax=Thanatephorus cucumeris (strain AG1-IA) TaxID=983506 RepID=L8X474_THACA|nr:hypothetical protein AG1IA_02067 [Rhizoctonia solani AG-1 IA]